MRVNAETFTVDCTKSVIMGKYGSSVVLPCWLTPKINAETLEIHWYRPDQFKSLVLFYQNYKILTDFQEMYKYRSSLTSRSPQSNGLKEGDVSLRLDNLSLSDIGIFYCYVSGDKSYDSKSVALNLTALGSPLQISLELHHNSVKLSSLSCGWFPQPSLLWNSTNAPYNLQSTNYIAQKNGLFCIYSGVIVLSSNPNAINCSVTLSEEEKKSMSIYVKDGLSADYCVVWKILFAVALLFVLALFSIGFFLYRKYKDVRCQMKNHNNQKFALEQTWWTKDPEYGHVNTEPEISPLFNKTVECFGVLLDFAKNELPFYSATDSVHLFTMIIKFQGEVVPLFNPGLGDRAPLRIINSKRA